MEYNEDKIIKEENQKSGFPLIFLNIVLFSILCSFVFMLIKASNTKEEIITNNNHKKKVVDDQKIKAKSIYVYDVLNNEILFEKNSKEKMPLASLTKIMTAFTAREILPKDFVLTINKSDLSEEGDNGLLVGENWELNTLINYFLSVSSNDATRSVASVAGAVYKDIDDRDVGRNIFIERMNSLAKEYNLFSLEFKNETGIDDEFILGGLGSAEDISKLFALAIKKYPDMFETSRKKESNLNSLNKKHKASNTNEFVSNIPNILGSKTGWTSQAGGNLTIAYDFGIGRPIIITVLGSTPEGRFEDILFLERLTTNFLTE